MTRVLLIGYDPDAVDFSDPALPPGIDAGMIRAGIVTALTRFRDRGWEADHCLIRPDGDAVAMVERQLAASRYDCVVIGAGIRLPPRSLLTFEALLNAIHRGAPGAALALNTRPEDSDAAAARWLGAAAAKPGRPA